MLRPVGPGARVDLRRNCEGIGMLSVYLWGWLGGRHQSTLLAPEINRERSREPLSGRREGAPFPSAFGRKGKRLPGPESPQRDKRILDGGGGAPRGVPEAYTRGIRWCLLQNSEGPCRRWLPRESAQRGVEPCQVCIGPR